MRYEQKVAHALLHKEWKIVTHVLRRLISYVWTVGRLFRPDIVHFHFIRVGIETFLRELTYNF